MDITVCICTHDRPRYVRDCLDGLRCQTVGPDRCDILVVDSASTAEVAEQLRALVADCANARLLRIDRPGVSAARNEGAPAAPGESVAYSDDDAIPAPNWIERIIEAIGARNPPPAMIGGRILPRWEAPLPAWWPPRLRGVLSIIEHEGEGEYRTPELPAEFEP